MEQYYTMGRKITTAEAAAILGVKKRAVQAAIERGSLKAERFGSAYVLDEDDVIERKNRLNRGEKLEDDQKND